MTNGLLDSVTTAFYKALAAGNFAEAQMILEEAGECIDASTRAAMWAALANANKIHHISDEVGHNLEALVAEYGGQAQAYDAIQEAANQVASQLANGVTTIIVNVGGQEVTITGNIVNGVMQIGTAYVKN